MNLDGLTLSLFCRELKNQLLNGQISRLHQIDKHTLVFSITGQLHSFDFVVTTGNKPAAYMTTALKDLPKEPTSLCMYLRKHIEGARITQVEQLYGDRIIVLSVDKLTLAGELAQIKIYLELMGKHTNCIFVQENVILESLIHVTPLMSQERSIGPKLAYTLPPNANRMSLLEVENNEIEPLLQNYAMDSIGMTIRNVFNGIGPQLLKEICYRAKVSEKDVFSPEMATNLSAALNTIKTELKESEMYYEYKNVKGKTFYTPIPLTYSLDEFTLTNTYTVLSPLLEEEVKKAGSINTATHELESIIKQAISKEELRHKRIEDELADTDKADYFKKLGDLLMINAYLQPGYATEITVQDILQDAVDSKNPEITIPIKPLISIAENAQQYYKQYTKLKNRAIYGVEQLVQSKVKLEYLNSILYSISLATDRASLQEIRLECEAAGLIRKNKKSLSYKSNKHNHIHVILPYGELFIGRNNQQNEYLTHRFAKPNDIWLHSQTLQGSHVIFRSPMEPTEEQISEVACYAAYYSKGRDHSRVPVDYTRIKYIKKPPASPLGFVIFSQHNTMYVEPKEPPH